jgi:hypothetical protein
LVEILKKETLEGNENVGEIIINWVSDKHGIVL